MKDLHRIIPIAKADFLERSRSYGFLVTLILTLYGASFFLPAQNAQYMALASRGFRGIYTSDWVGLCAAVSTSLLLGLAGFYLVKNTLAKDENSGVGQLYAASPTGKTAYIFGKALSNFLLLLSILVAVILSSIIMFYLRGEAEGLQLINLLIPFVVIALPTLLVVSAVAILFETLPGLKGGLGNVAYFFGWIFALIIPINLMEKGSAPHALAYIDVFGFSKTMDAINQKVLALYPNSPETAGLFTSVGTGGAKTFLWSGMEWTPDILLGRLLWVAVGIGILLLSSLLFNRFDKRSVGLALGSKKPPKKQDKGKANRPEPVVLSWLEKNHPLGLSGTGQSEIKISLPRLLKAELQVMLKGLNKSWYAGLIVLNLLAVVIPSGAVMTYLLPLCWIMPLFIWSDLGVKASKHKTLEMIYSSVGGRNAQFAAMALAGVFVTALSSLGPFVRWALTGNALGLMSWTAAIFFIPFLALACGVLTKTSRTFEALYVILWYIGPISGLAYLDFIGVVKPSAEMGMPLWYGLLAIVFLVVALLQHRRLVKG